MQGTHAEQWSGEGYERIDELPAVLPWQSFTVDIEVGVERELSAPEAAVLALVVAGHGDPAELRELLGLEDDRLVAMSLARLLQKTAITRGEGGFEATPGGMALRASGRSSDLERTSEVLHFQAVSGRFEWSGPREVGRILPTHVPLPFLEELSAVDVERSLPKLQALVRERGVPSIDLEDRRAKIERGRRELRALRVVNEAVRWREVRVEVWRNETGHERLRICTEAGEDPDATQRYEGFRWNRGAIRGEVLPES